MNISDKDISAVSSRVKTLRDRAEKFGFCFHGQQAFEEPVKAKPRSHDDGTHNGPFMGGLGNPMFSRSIDGHFDRWQLEPGVHLHERIEPAFVAISWTQNGKNHFCKLQVGDSQAERPEKDRHYQALFPLAFESWTSESLPADISLTLFSPQIPNDLPSSALPITFIHIEHDHWKADVESLSIALFWPNLVGWSMMPLTAVERKGKHWPNQTHAGQYHQVVKHTDQLCHLAHRIKTFDRRHHPEEILLSAQSSNGDISFHLTAKANQNETGTPYTQQRYTLAWLEAQFTQHGKFTNDDSSWEAHWHEPLMSAIAAKFSCKGDVTFAITFDHPTITFGQGRQWWRAYTKEFGRSGRIGHQIADSAFRMLPDWLTTLDEWQKNALMTITSSWDVKTAGAILNEYWSISAGAAAWVSEPVTELDKQHQHFRNNEHFAWLEGFDSGYFYYNTLDLFVYGFAGLHQLWPDLAQSVFEDYQDTAELVLDDKRIIYRQGIFGDLLVKGKLPHDLGSPSADPWISLNGYVMRDDPNVWKDHNSSFIVSYFLHKELLRQDIERSDLLALQSVAAFIEQQISPDIAMPVHEEFGDSTWDNLDMKGLSSYTGSWVIAAWAVMSKIHRHFGNTEESNRYQVLLKNAQSHFETLWNGKHYRTNSEGKYANATQCDALIGIYFAKLAGLGDLLPIERIQMHLDAVWENNVKAYRNGCYGPLLIAEPGKQQFDRDGGEELQVNEVLVGSAWIYIGMLSIYGSKDKANSLAQQMVTFQYRRSGLQFRTPAAWNGDGLFRAPINMRPLSIALLRYC